MIQSSENVVETDKIQNGELQFRGSQAYGFYNGIHLVIIPAPHGGTGFHVFFTENNNGKPDFSRIKDSLAIDGNLDDLPEIADAFMRRLTGGVPISNIFKDFHEQNRKSIQDAYEKYKQE
jgi:hypothetical protein